MKKISLFLLSLGFLKIAAQVNQPLHSSEILQALKKLNTLGSVLYVAAHPDDENTRLLSYLANEKKLRTGYLSITRGDGGQNLIGKEQGELLGLIRTQELLAARRVDGAEQFFTRANDFGFSKNPEETFSFWNKDSILSDVVWIIRTFKPEVIICRFPTTGEGGHGHHTASAILALEAFSAAADPKKFPEQLKYTETWQAKRIYWNTFNFGTTNTTSPDQLKLDVGTFNPLLGKSYGEIASESRSMHKSQGFGAARQRGSNIEYFKFLKGDTSQTDLFKGIDQNWKKLPGGEKIQQELETCIRSFSPENPEKSVPELVAIYKQISALNDKDILTKYWKQQKLNETEKLLLACSGLWLEALAGEYSAIPGQAITFTAQAINRNKSNVTLNGISFSNANDTTTNLNLKSNELYSFKRKVILNAGSLYSNPYWLNTKVENGRYVVNDKTIIGKPENEAAYKVEFNVSILDLPLKIKRAVVYKYTDPVKGEIYRPFEILPPVTINFPEKCFVFTDSAQKRIQILVKANAPNLEGTLQVDGGNSWKVLIQQPSFKLVNKGDEMMIDAIVTRKQTASFGTLKATAIVDNVTCSQSIYRVEYDHIPYQFVLKDSEAKVVPIDLKKSGDNIAYIPGAGDEVAVCLKQAGYKVTVLNDEQIRNADLSEYSAIITGIRAFNTNAQLPLLHQKLMDYVKNGGNLVVQYNTNSRVGPLQTRIGPYPFNISRDRVTDEKAKVNLKNEPHAALNFPNKITEEDFKGWVQELGIYFATEIDPQYDAIFTMNDPGEKPSTGSLIIGRYGRGNFVYTGLAFFRQLPAGVPGAYRLFANLLSLPQNKTDQ
jgi:LmbE family N-acetylglucosaminyl deacetylase